MPRLPPLYAHQKKTLNLYKRQWGREATPDRPCAVFDASDPGTAKTRPALLAYAKYGMGRMLVIAPKSTVESVWLNEIHKWLPGVSAATALAPDYDRGYRSKARIVVTNTDAVKWLAENNPRHKLKAFDTVVVDESDAFKHQHSARSRALREIRRFFKNAACLSGTPHANSVLDLWHQFFFLDPNLLGQSFYDFRNACAYEEQVGHKAEMKEWREFDEAVEAVFDMVKSICIRHEFDKCLDISPMHTHTVPFTLNRKTRKLYEEFRKECITILKDNRLLKATTPAALRQKLLQIASGAVYNSENSYSLVDEQRYNLITELVEARNHSIVFFNWRHQRIYLMEALRKKKLSVDYIDGTVSTGKRTKLVRDFQAGKLRCLLLHPKAAAHGITLIKGTSCLWASPIYEPNIFRQGAHRIRRAGQTQRTECVLIEATGTVERLVYNKLQRKDAKMMEFLDMLEAK